MPDKLICNFNFTPNKQRDIDKNVMALQEKLPYNAQFIDTRKCI